MNLGIYIQNFNNTDLIENINNLIENNSNKMYDISLFFDNIGFNPFKTKCGIFNSTDLWSFSGDLIVTSNECAHTATNIINHLNIYYYYMYEKDPNFLGLIQLSKKIKFIANSERCHKYLYRSTGVKPIFISDNIEQIIPQILELNDGHKSNINYVYQT